MAARWRGLVSLGLAVLGDDVARTHVACFLTPLPGWKTSMRSLSQSESFFFASLWRRRFTRGGVARMLAATLAADATRSNALAENV